MTDSKYKYEIIISEGCTAFYTLVNEKIVGDSYDPNSLSKDEEDKLIEYLLTKVKEGISEGSIHLDNLIRLFQYDEYETDDYSCDTCGDQVSREIYRI